MRKLALNLTTSMVISVALGTAAWGQTESSASTAPSSDVEKAGSFQVEEVIVTARRREESLQDVPVSVAAFSGAALEARTVQTLSDLTTIAPGLRFSAEGGKGSTTLSLRGMSQVPLGDVIPAVVTYFAEVPLAVSGSNIPTYDIGSVQVLKGPQGTLFGRNTLGGAVLIQPQAPSYEFGGYGKVTYGRFDYYALEGALNAPIVADTVALRVAGQIRRQDGRSENLSGGKDFDDIHQDSFRASLLLEPTDEIKNTMIFDWFEANEAPGASYLLRVNEGVIPGLSALLDPQLLAYRDIQRQDFFGASDDAETGFLRRKIWGIANSTSIELGNFTVRNIFGYRRTKKVEAINSSGAGALMLPGAVFGLPDPEVPFTLADGAGTINREYFTNETQLLATFERINVIAGVFYGNDQSVGGNGSNFKFFRPTAAPADFTTSHIENTNYAVFAQVGYELTDTLTLNLGGRYSWDDVESCGGNFGLEFATTSECKDAAALGLVDGIGTVKNKGEEPSWTIGLDYKPNEDLLLYAVTRRGYRGVNVNTPRFESPFTTGGAGCALGTTPVPCPDLRAFQSTGEETLTDGELGAKWDFTVGDARGNINVAGFYYEYKDAVQFLNTSTLGLPLTTPDTPFNGSVGVNVADQSAWGIELQAVVQPISSVTVSFNGAYTKQEVDAVRAPESAGFPPLTKDQITLPAPRFSGNLAVSWTLPVRPADGEVVLNGDFYKTEKFGAQFGQDLPGYEVSNFRVDWNDIAGSGVAVGAYVRNAFDEKYYTAPIVLLPAFPTSAVYVGDERTWGVEARYDF